MLAFFFGTKQRQLFGIYEPAANHTRVRRAVLLCNSWGNEYLYAHRTIRQLARRLAAAGFDTLRFDYFGSGDSGGETTEAELSGWQQDILSAVRELKEMSGVRQVDIVGLRLGATLAAQVSSQLVGDLHRLVLWDPIVHGEEHVSEIIGDRGQGDEAKKLESCYRDGDGCFQLHGYQLSAAFVSGLKAINLCSEEPSHPTKILTTLSTKTLADCKLLSSGEFSHIEVASPWKDPSERGEILPVQVFDRIITWLQ